MNLLALPAFTDNYIWMLHDGREAIVVDPGDAAPVLGALASLKLTLAAILVTHHHHDHIGGLDGLRSVLEGPVFTPAGETIPGPGTPVADGQVLRLPGSTWTVVDVPGHTAGHVAYVSHDAGPDPILFCGDTLFSAGCGRLREGTPAQMHRSLQRLARLPAGTRVCCAHEYTLANLAFAQAVEPGNQDIASHRAWCIGQRAQSRPTLPSTLALELKINPFLRCAEPGVAEQALRHGAASRESEDVFAALRQWKNQF